MDMASKDDINFVMDKPTLKDRSHTFTLHEVCFVTVVYWDMHENNEPRCLLSVNLFKFFFEPPPLWCVLNCRNVKSIFD